MGAIISTITGEQPDADSRQQGKGAIGGYDQGLYHVGPNQLGFTSPNNVGRPPGPFMQGDSSINNPSLIFNPSSCPEQTPNQPSVNNNSNNNSVMATDTLQTNQNLPPKIVPQEVLKQTAPDLSILSTPLTANEATKKSVFGSVHGWNDPPIKAKDSSVDSSAYRKQKRKRQTVVTGSMSFMNPDNHLLNNNNNCMVPGSTTGFEGPVKLNGLPLASSTTLPPCLPPTLPVMYSNLPPSTEQVLSSNFNASPVMQPENSNIVTKKIDLQFDETTGKNKVVNNLELKHDQDENAEEKIHNAHQLNNVGKIVEPTSSLSLDS